MLCTDLYPHKTIMDIIEYFPEYYSILNNVLNAGSDNVKYFGGVFEGGYNLQQAPEEIAALCSFLRMKPIDFYGEIGVAAGGCLRFIYENVEFKEAAVIDDGKHPKFNEQEKNLSSFSGLVKRFIGDSHSVEANNFLKETVADRKFDVLFIDGDHSYIGLCQDIVSVISYCTASTYLIFHDTIAVPDIGRLVDSLVISGRFKLLAHFAANELSESKRTMGIAVCSINF